MVKLQVIEYLTSVLSPYLRELRRVTRNTNYNKAEIMTLTKLISAQSNDSSCRATFAVVGKLNTQFNVDKY